MFYIFCHVCCMCTPEWNQVKLTHWMQLKIRSPDSSLPVFLFWSTAFLQVHDFVLSHLRFHVSLYSLSLYVMSANVENRDNDTKWQNWPLQWQIFLLFHPSSILIAPIFSVFSADSSILLFFLSCGLCFVLSAFLFYTNIFIFTHLSISCHMCDKKL